MSQLTKQLNVPTRIILFGTFFTRTAFFMSTPFLSIYLTTVLHLPITETGIIISAFPLIIVLLSGLVGRLVDNFSLRLVLSVVAFFWGLTFILFYFATTFWQFLLLNCLNGCCYAFFEPAAKKVLSLETTSDQRLMTYNIRYAAINLGGFFGPLLSQFFHIQKSLVAYLPLGCCYILYSLVLLYTLSKQATPLKDKQTRNIHQGQWIFSDRAFIFLLIGVAFSYFGYAQFNSTLAQYLTLSPHFSNGSQIYAYILSLNSACILLLQFILLRVTQTLSATSVLLISNLFLASSVVLCGLAATLWGFVFIALIYSLGELLLGSRFDTLVDDMANEDLKGVYFGFAEWIKTGSVLGPIIGAQLLQTTGADRGTLLFPILGSITFLGSFFIILSKKKPRQARLNSNATNPDASK